MGAWNPRASEEAALSGAAVPRPRGATRPLTADAIRQDMRSVGQRRTLALGNRAGRLTMLDRPEIQLSGLLVTSAASPLAALPTLPKAHAIRVPSSSSVAPRPPDAWHVAM